MTENGSSRGGSPSAEIVFRTPRLHAVKADAGAADRLQSVFDVCGDYFLSLTGRPEPEPDAAAREIRACEEAPDRNVTLLVDEDHTPIGVLGWWEGQPDAEAALLGTLMVVPGRRGAGIAREALHGLSDHLGSRGVRRMHAAIASGDRERERVLRALRFAALDERRHVDVPRGRIMLALYERPTDGARGA